MSRSLVIVGSGNSLLGSKLGSFIDSQDAVVRFGGHFRSKICLDLYRGCHELGDPF